ncbi:uncharacterized protein [Cardiocondyla obscurior]|uniref:uncharacterized protein n=1 Tax=Cardiocondyla obscurior TaxID=286306 RepID=UPI0039658BA9
MCTVVFIHLKIRTDMFNSIYIVLVYTYSLVVNSINIFELYMFTSCLEIKFRLVNQLLRESLTSWSAKETKLGIFEIKDYIKIMDSEQRKRTLSMKVILRWRQIVSQKRVAVVSQIDSYFPFQYEERFPSELQNRPQRCNLATKCQKMKSMLQVTK